MKPRTILALSVFAGLLAVLLVQVQLRSERGETVVVFRATETIAPGQAIGNRIEEVTLPGDKLFPNLLREAPTAELREYVTTTTLRETVHAGQMILYRHLEATVDAGLRSQIPPGLKGIALEVDAASAVAYLVEPGDRVDVIGTVSEAMQVHGESPVLAQIEERLQRQGSLDADLFAEMMVPTVVTELVTRRLLEDVEVLAVGRRYRRAEPSEVGTRYDTVTLLVDDEQARALAAARDARNSAMTLVLRSPADDKTKPEL